MKPTAVLPKHVAPWIRAVAATSLIALFGGCAALTNPVSHGVPVRELPPELLALPKEPMQTIPLSFLRRSSDVERNVAAGDILGIYVEGVLGGGDAPLPVYSPQIGSDEQPAIGFPIPVRDDGTLPLPLIEPVNVSGLTLREVEKKLIQIYGADKQILEPGNERIMVTMIRPRSVRVRVVRQDSTSSNNLRVRGSGGRLGTARAGRGRGFLGQAEAVIGGTRRGTGTVVELPPGENDVLTALTLSGGLPGLDAANEVIIFRGQESNNGTNRLPAPQEAMGAEFIPPPECSPVYPYGAGQVIRIPLRLYPGAPVPFSPEDVILETGDVLFIEARDTEVFYAGGILPSGEYALPRDYDLDVVEAVMQIGGPIVNGGVNASNLSGAIIEFGLGSPSPKQVTVLRRTLDDRQVPILIDLHAALRDPRENLILQPRDVVILQETKCQAVTRYFTQTFFFNFASEFLSSSKSTAVGSFRVP